MIKKILLLVILITIKQIAYAQYSEILERYKEEGLENNVSLQQENLEVKKILETVRQARSLFYPHIAFNPTYSYATGGRNINFPVGDLLNPVYKSLNDLLGKQQFQANIENVDFLLAPTNFHDTKFTVQYALYNPEIKYNYLIQKHLFSAQEAKVKVVNNELRYFIETAYLQYLQTLEITRIYENATGILEGMIRLNKSLVANQKITKDAVASAEYELSKVVLNKTESLKNSQIAKAYFNFLLNKNLHSEILIDTLLIKHLFKEEREPVDVFVQQALQNRSELKQFDYLLKAADEGLTMHQKAAFLPKLFVGGNFGFQGYGYTFKNQAYLIGQAGLQWDLFKGYDRKSKINQAKIQIDLVKLKKLDVEHQIEFQTNQAYQEWISELEACKVTLAGLNSAQANFKIVDSRYKNQNALQIEHLKAQNDVMTAQIQQVITQFNVRIKRALLSRITAVL